MTQEELGAALRAEREKRMLAIEEVAERLKISGRVLRALEEGDETNLPPPTYAKGFLRTYAVYLGFSVDEVRDALQSLSTTPTAVVPQQKLQPSSVLTEPEPASPHSRKFVWSILGLVIACGVCWLAWHQGMLKSFEQRVRQVVQSRSESPVSPKEPAPSDVGRHVALPGTSPGTSSSTLPSRRSYEPVKPALPPASPPSQDVSTVAIPAAQPQTQPQPASIQPVASSMPTSSGVHKVVITTLETCWVHSTADKTDTRQFSLHKGDTFVLPFHSSLELKLGNAGGVRLRYDGRDVPPPGRMGQVRTVTFPPTSAEAR